MKQGDKFLKIVMFLLAAAVLLYFGHAAVRYLSAPLTTVPALEYEANAGITLTGYVVRDEILLQSAEPLVVPLCEEGAHIGSGQAVAAVYGSADALTQQNKIAALEAQLHQLQYATDPGRSMRTLHRDIALLLTEYAICQTGQQSGDAAELADELKGLVLRSSTDDTGMEHLLEEQAALERQHSSLVSQTGAINQIPAPEPGYFSGKTDGYEAVLTPTSVTGMTLAQYDALASAAEAVPANAYGKLIRSDRWYYITAAESGALGTLAAGDAVTLVFARDAATRMEMQVEQLEAGDDGRTLLVLSCERYMPRITLLRNQTCDLIFASYSGLRVPKNAVHVDKDGQSGVYVLEGAIARWKPIELLYETSDNYVAKLDTSSTGNLWPGDEILLGNNLHDGKVVYP